MDSDDKLFLGLILGFFITTIFCIFVGTNFTLKNRAAQNHLVEKCLQTSRAVSECKELNK